MKCPCCGSPVITDGEMWVCPRCESYAHAPMPEDFDDDLEDSE